MGYIILSCLWSASVFRYILRKLHTSLLCTGNSRKDWVSYRSRMWNTSRVDHEILWSELLGAEMSLSLILSMEGRARRREE
jgi:hypothetical protein